MYLARLLKEFSYLSKRNIVSYSTINTSMENEDGENSVRRMRVIREYDIDTNNLLYSNIKDYNNDSEIDNKYIITNRYDWYLNNRNTYNVRYIPLFVTNIKRNKEKLEDIISNNNITKIYECAISTITNKWNELLINRNVNDLKQILGDIYIVPSNNYIAVSANYSEDNIKNGIISYSYSSYLSCKNNLITSYDLYNDFTLNSFTAIYNNYDINNYYWFDDECFNSLFAIFSKLINKDITLYNNHLCGLQIEPNMETINLCLKLKALSVKLLNSYENDVFSNCDDESKIYIEVVKQLEGI